MTALCLVLLGTTVASAAKKPDRVGDLRSKTMSVRIDKAAGPDRWRKVTPRTKIFLVTKAGARTRADADELVRGAQIVGSKVRGKRVRAISLRALPGTGAADCSFDSADDDGDKVTDEDSFDCSHDYDDGTVDTESDCSYDSSRDGGEGDWSLDASWDCSFSETDDREEDGGLEWDCSFSASADGSSDAEGSESDADLDFDCSWEGASTDSALWSCTFLPGVLGFRCVSKQLNQEFGYTIDVEDMSLDGGLDFQRTVVGGDAGAGEGIDCTGSAAAGYGCSVEGESESGDCEVEWSFDRSRAVTDGDVSGSLSYSCSTETDGDDEGDDADDADDEEDEEDAEEDDEA